MVLKTSLKDDILGTWRHRRYLVNIINLMILFLQITMETSDNIPWIEDFQKIAELFQRLVEKEPLTEKAVETFLEILEQLRDIVNMIPADEHQDTMKVS